MSQEMMPAAPMGFPTGIWSEIPLNAFSRNGCFPSILAAAPGVAIRYPEAEGGDR